MGIASRDEKRTWRCLGEGGDLGRLGILLDLKKE